MNQQSKSEQTAKNTTKIAMLEDDINDIDAIFNDSNMLGIFQRQRAIDKIHELRVKNQRIGMACSMNAIVNGIPFSVATNNQIAGELQTIRESLCAEYLEKSIKAISENSSI